MDSISFVGENDKKSGVRIIINGRDLIEIVREIELPFATREGSPQIAGAYSGLPAHRVFLPSQHFSDNQTPSTLTERAELTCLSASAVSQAVGPCRFALGCGSARSFGAISGRSIGDRTQR